ncbi:larval/pupal cuticle protein H1C [Drosophila novamexicana]|uniref:larval/pupal cuticle protein H1C n=1 Tax=Drosophila novamexicana TaxID=47314 RepID=UPI0011E5FE16|nr:larval/pupal cuticle protein H1C [Drosophila novamexicana]
MAHQILALTLLLLLSPAWAGISYLGDEHAVAHTQQHVVRSYDGTVSHYAKSVATPYSQVHKQDTRISNNVYQPAIAKSLSYAAPAPVSVGYATHQPTLFTQAAPLAPVYQQQQQQQQHIPAAQASYASHQPVVVHYSPAETVSHMSFDGFGTHWGY